MSLQKIHHLICFELTVNLASTNKFQIEINHTSKKKITLIGTGREYGNFGDRIINTLTGDLEICEDNRVIARALGTAGLERRIPDNTLT